MELSSSCTRRPSQRLQPVRGGTERRRRWWRGEGGRGQQKAVGRTEIQEKICRGTLEHRTWRENTERENREPPSPSIFIVVVDSSNLYESADYWSVIKNKHSQLKVGFCVSAWLEPGLQSELGLCSGLEVRSSPADLRSEWPWSGRPGSRLQSGPLSGLWRSQGLNRVRVGSSQVRLIQDPLRPNWDRGYQPGLDRPGPQSPPVRSVKDTESVWCWSWATYWSIWSLYSRSGPGPR